ncbi:MAG: nickel-dependent hydrogenase large subunit [Candidatus Aminicenantales bacterium]
MRLELKGNYIQSARIRLGYAHRGIEQLVEGKNILQALYTVERICGICEFAHSGAYTRAIESILNFKPAKKVAYLRMLIAELERIHSHLLWAGYMAHEIGYEIIFQFFWREREKILEIFEKLTGGRVHHNFNKIGTVRYDLGKGDDKFILQRVNSVEKKILDYLSVYSSDKIIRARLKGVGLITKEEAKKYCLVGPIARASGIKIDVRKDDPYLAYKSVNFKIITEPSGDALARTTVRLKEILESIKIISQLIRGLPKEKLPVPKHYRIKDKETVGRVEAPRGENFHFHKIKDNIIQRARVRTPTYRNIIVLEKLLAGAEIADTPVILSSLDPCFGCMERVMIVKRRKTKLLNEQEFRRRYCV